MKLGRTGFGDLVPAMYDIPQNPVMLAYYAQQNAVSKAAGLGVFVPASFNEPDNPVRKGMTNGFSNALAMQGSFEGPKQLVRGKTNAVVNAHQRMKASGTTASGMKGVHGGIGALDFTSIDGLLTSVQTGTSFGVSNVVLVAVGAAALFFLGSSGSRARR